MNQTFCRIVKGLDIYATRGEMERGSLERRAQQKELHYEFLVLFGRALFSVDIADFCK